MAVKVFVGFARNTSAMVITHESATTFRVEDGHLVVTRSGDSVGVYAPGKWESASANETDTTPRA